MDETTVEITPLMEEELAAMGPGEDEDEEAND